jgi:hypothetical protein
MSILEISKYNSKQMIILSKILKPYKMKKKEKKFEKDNFEVLTSLHLSKIKGGESDDGGDHGDGGGNGGPKKDG